MKSRSPLLLLLFCSACATVPQPYRGEYQSTDSRDVVGYAKSLIGTPYRYGGDSPQTGFDCSGFVRHVYRHSEGVTLPHNAREISRVGAPIQASELRPGDLVFYNTLHRAYSHVGIYLGNRRFVHAPSSGKHVEIVDMNMDYWQSHYNGARRIAARYR